MRRILLILGITLATTSCRSSLLGFGATAPEALRHVSEALLSHAQRFDDVVRDTKFTQARTVISRFALTPSRIYSDSSVWTDVNDRDSSRSVTVAGSYDQLRTGYTFSTSPNVRAPQALGSSRHVMRLELEPDGAYAWDTSVDQAIGTMPAAFAGRALTMLFASAESPAARDLRSESAQAFPRTARALGRLFSIDSARSTPLADGSSSTALAVQWHSDRISGTMPYFAAYVAKYIEPSTYRITLQDRRGQTYFQAHGDKGRLLVRWRSRVGRLLPLEGGGSAMPDSLRLRLDFNTKYKMFRVGFSDMTADFIVQRGPHLAAWMMRFRQEPKWKLPLFTETLIRSPLRRPFQGRGSELYLGVRDDAGPQTQLVRQTHTEVKESAIIRWIGSLGATAMSDFQGRAEAQENRFLSEAFAALRADAQEVLGAPPNREP